MSFSRASLDHHFQSYSSMINVGLGKQGDVLFAGLEQHCLPSSRASLVQLCLPSPKANMGHNSQPCPSKFSVKFDEELG